VRLNGTEDKGDFILPERIRQARQPELKAAGEGVTHCLAEAGQGNIRVCPQAIEDRTYIS